jgi:hypothetical protein
MDRLSSCYFCGDAVDAALEEYPLVDPDHQPDVETDERIVLCPTCRRKLTAVVERVLEAALNGETADVEAGEVANLGDDAELVDLDESLEQADNGEEMTATSVEQVDDESERTYASSTAASDLSANDDETSTEVGDEAQSSDGPTDETEETDADETDESTATERDSRDDEQPVEGSEQTVGEQRYTRAEHNKVVKLLQNREFPVEIEEITVVARSAYGIDRDTTHAILEALIERGVVEDRGDRLVRA